MEAVSNTKLDGVSKGAGFVVALRKGLEEDIVGEKGWSVEGWYDVDGLLGLRLWAAGRVTHS